MADTVQYRLERMTDELDDLERRGLFTRAELSDVVRKRRDFEYRLRRHSPLRQDFLDYIAYELRLDSLRNLRKRAIIRAAADEDDEPRDGARSSDDEEGGGRKRKKKDKSKKKWKKSVSDVAGVLRVLDIYRMATVRFKGDLDLWFRYLEFCRDKKHGRMKQVLAQAIRFHPKVPGLWIYAAAWEFDQNLNVAAARALMQSGLRSCPQSEDMWIEYLRMELTYLNKLKARKVALGEDVKTLQKNDKDSGQWKEENKELFMPLNEQDEDPKEPGLSGDALEEKEDLFWRQGLLIIQTIYQGAVEALPSSLTLRKKFLEILNSVDLAHSDELKLEVLDDLKRDFYHSEDYWDWLARLQLSNSNSSSNSNRKDAISNRLNRSIQVYDEAVRRLSNSKMYSLYAKFWMDVLYPDREDSITLFEDSEFDASEFTSSILKVYENAESCGCLTEDLACQYISLYLKLERLEEAKTLAEKLCDGPLSNAAKLWSLRASMEINSIATAPGSSSLSKENLSSLFDLFSTVLSKLSVTETEGLWHMAMKLFFHDKVFFEKLVKISTLSLSLAGGSDSGASVSSAIVGWYLQRDGMKHARKMYKRFLALPRPSLKFMQYCIELEANLASLGDHGALTNARRLYDSALDLYPQEREVWRNYYNLELKMGTSESANAVYSRARKVLGDSTALTAPRS
ncbi:U3 small nucleolar RNA-associated protein 6 homolog [Sorghum bicolor]|uniref:Suppressor of forked domain-containing protein n=1 Tax=Sorghum bicolor TaxID=4558 RepID=C5X762_SORBI|nr:U3 small nucleolar RNA-associated protein 6 homolog [Sorghum bicolor]EER95733.1 hypothetical protein SORBI_3002G005000 [Sorghum bicolor]|eukprot:XP_002459212.1 U3 small nucleolar RNA-associated protein 6 homolog [Sorghum bicolor]